MVSSLSLVYEAVDQVNAQIEDGAKIVKDPATPLLDSKGGIDSLAMVNLVVGVEQIVFDQTGKTITIVDENVYSSPDSPFKTIGTLAAYIDKLTS
jgi:acyl carrier protein